jgi:predicted nuclease of predicted toxin-antitoxin system
VSRVRRRPGTQTLPSSRVKLLLDENLSDRIVPQILDLYPDSAHIKSHQLMQADDGLIWAFTKQHGFTIVSKDSDFHQRSLLFGHPPKLVFMRVGNCATKHVVDVLRTNFVLISAFDSALDASILVLPSQPSD